MSDPVSILGHPVLLQVTKPSRGLSLAGRDCMNLVASFLTCGTPRREAKLPLGKGPSFHLLKDFVFPVCRGPCGLEARFSHPVGWMERQLLFLFLLFFLLTQELQLFIASQGWEEWIFQPFSWLRTSMGGNACPWRRGWGSVEEGSSASPSSAVAGPHQGPRVCSRLLSTCVLVPSLLWRCQATLKPYPRIGFPPGQQQPQHRVLCGLYGVLVFGVPRSSPYSCIPAPVVSLRGSHAWVGPQKSETHREGSQ